MSTPAFKEWKLIADALSEGRQSLLVRKGGLHEGREGFAFSHERFWIFPTWFHAQADSLKGDVVLPQENPENSVHIETWAEIVLRKIVTDWETIEKLDSHHLWTPELLRRRFEQDNEHCLHVAIVRIHKLPAPWVLPMEKRYGGCRSWVELPEPEGLMASARPVVSDEEHNKHIKTMAEILDGNLDEAD